jgi:hypothetical protein
MLLAGYFASNVPSAVTIRLNCSISTVQNCVNLALTRKIHFIADPLFSLRTRGGQENEFECRVLPIGFFYPRNGTQRPICMTIFYSGTRSKWVNLDILPQFADVRCSSDSDQNNGHRWISRPHQNSKWSYAVWIDVGFSGR